MTTTPATATATTEIKPKTFVDFLLPQSLISKLDVARLLSEVERIDNELTTASVRAKANAAQQPQPVLSSVLEEFLVQNQLTLVNPRDRTELIKQLRLLKDKVPVVHMTFAVPADPESLQKIASWLRSSVHPQAVISVGLQPALVAGVYLRTPNRIHDLSVRAKIEGGHSILMKELESLRGSR